MHCVFLQEASSTALLGLAEITLGIPEGQGTACALASMFHDCHGFGVIALRSLRAQLRSFRRALPETGQR